MSSLYAALIHHPVVNKNGQTIASALTNLDLHDISRATKTFGLKAFFVVTPLEDQIELIQKIISHWTEGIGAQYNPKRRSALEMIRVSSSYADVIERVTVSEGTQPKTIATSARQAPANISYQKCRTMLNDNKPYVLALGTAWGLSQEFLSAADYVLEPIAGNTGYNHLSVRSAAAIIFDRLLG
ncbi:MAG: RNA methyltransferase [Desulfobacterales bacterium]